MAHPVEEPVEIDIDDPGLPGLDRPPRRFHGLVGAPTGPEAEAPVRERRFEDGAEDLAQRLLEEAIEDRRHAQLAHTAAGLGDRHPADGAGSVRAIVEALADPGPGGLQIRSKLSRRHAVGSRSAAVALDAPECPGEVVPCEEDLPESPGPGGVRGRLGRRRIGTALCSGPGVASPPAPGCRPTTRVGWPRSMCRSRVGPGRPSD